jgi:hypothetical protein
MGLDVLSPAESLKSMLTPFSGANHSTRIVVVISAQGQTVRGQGSDGPRPDAGLGFPACRPDGPRPGAGRSARVQGRQRSPAALGSRSREGPRRGGEILGVV